MCLIRCWNVILLGQLPTLEVLAPSRMLVVYLPDIGFFLRIIGIMCTSPASHNYRGKSIWLGIPRRGSFRGCHQHQKMQWKQSYNWRSSAFVISFSNASKNRKLTLTSKFSTSEKVGLLRNLEAWPPWAARFKRLGIPRRGRFRGCH